MPEINWGLLDADPALTGVKNANTLLSHFAKIQAGKKLARGNVQGATNDLYQVGDLEGGNGVQNQQSKARDDQQKYDTAQHKESAQFTADTAKSLMAVLQQHSADPDGGRGAVMAGFDQLSPVLRQRGADDSHISTLRGGLEQDPATFLQMLNAQAEEKLASHVLTGNQELVDASGKTLAKGPGFQPRVVSVKDGDGTPHVLIVDPNTGEALEGAPGGRLAAPATAIAGPASAPAGAPPAGLGQLVMSGATLTSGTRTPQHNAEVGGVPNSEHLTGQAADLVPPQGMTLAQLAQHTRDLMPGAKVILEKDHVHVQWGGAAPAPAAAASRAQEVFRGVATPPSADYAVRRAGEGDPLFSPGTTVETDAKTGNTRVLQAPPKADAATGGAPKLNASDNAFLAKLRNQFGELQTMSSNMDQFVQLNRNVATGGKMALPGMGTVLSAVNPQIATMQSITNKLTPAMRNGLPGAASDRDVAMFRGATVGLDKPLEANQNIRDAAKAFAGRSGDYLAFLETYAAKKGTLLGSTEIWKNYVDTHPLFGGIRKDGSPIVNKNTPWRAVISLGGEAAPAASGRVRVYDPVSKAFH